MCSERRVLLSDYSETACFYADSVSKFTELVGGAIGSDVDLLRRNCRSAWDAVERARLALFRHEANHGCDRPDFSQAAATASSPR
jgi:hypothetical protein